METEYAPDADGVLRPRRMPLYDTSTFNIPRAQPAIAIVPLDVDFDAGAVTEIAGLDAEAGAAILKCHSRQHIRIIHPTPPIVRGRIDTRGDFKECIV